MRSFQMETCPRQRVLERSELLQAVGDDTHMVHFNEACGVWIAVDPTKQSRPHSCASAVWTSCKYSINAISTQAFEIVVSQVTQVRTRAHRTERTPKLHPWPQDSHTLCDGIFLERSEPPGCCPRKPHYFDP